MDYFYYYLLVILPALIPFPKTWKDPRLFVLLSFIACMASFVVLGRSVRTQPLTAVHVTLPLVVWALSQVPVKYSPDVERVLFKPCLVFLGMGFVTMFALLAPNFSPFEHHYANEHLTQKVRMECESHPENMYYMHIFPWSKEIFPPCSMISSVYKEPWNLLPEQDFLYLAPSVQQELQARGVSSDLTILLDERSRFIREYKIPREDALFLKMKYWEEHHGIKLRLEMERELDATYCIYRVVRGEPEV